MTTAQTSYTLDAVQLEAALGALRKASETFRPSRLEAHLYRSLGWSARVAVVTFLAMVVAYVADLSSETLMTLGIVLLAVGAVSALLLLVSVSLIAGTIRQRRLLKKLGLHKVSRKAWKADRRRHLGRWITGAALTTAGVVLLVFGGIVLLIFGVASLAMGKSAVGGVELVFIALFAVPGVTVLVWRMVERGREQLAVATDADGLRAVLLSMQARSGSGAPVVVPADVMEKVAGIETAQIARDRARAVVDSVRSVDRGFGLVLAPEVTVQKAALGTGERLAVEELIDEVLAAPGSFGKANGGGLRQARSADGSTEIDYRMDEAARRVHIMAVRGLASPA